MESSNRKSDEIKFVIGAGEYNNNPGWIHTKEEELNILDESAWQNRFDVYSIKAILAEHVWEHFTYEKGVAAAKLCRKYLKPLGYIRCAVPNGYFPDEFYQQIVQVGGPDPKDHPASSHKIVHTYQTIITLLETAGYEVRLLEHCDENGEFHQYDWCGEDDFIFRSKKYDHRNQGEQLVFPSLIIDAIKPK